MIIITEFLIHKFINILYLIPWSTLTSSLHKDENSRKKEN